MNNGNINVVVFIEGDERKEFIEMTIISSMTFWELKQEALKRSQIPIHLQAWIINDQIPQCDEQILNDFNVSQSNCRFFLSRRKSNAIFL